MTEPFPLHATGDGSAPGPEAISAPGARALALDSAGASLGFRLMLRAAGRLETGTLDFLLPDGARLRFAGKQPLPRVEIHVRNWRMANRIIAKGDIGLAEGLIAGEWDSPDLAGLLTMLSDNFDALWQAARGKGLFRFFNLLRHAMNSNTRAGSRRNIHAHYDLGNEFYRIWLDRSMTYSSARYSGGNESLEGAQANKYRAIAENLALAPGDHVLEIGSGWGGFAEVAARDFGARVTGLTISPAQYAFARQRIFEAGLAERVTFELRDYRDVAGQYDKVASIEMFEAVGEKYWPVFFGKVRDVLSPGGRAALQIITIRNDLFARYRTRSDFIQRFIFPGGMLPSEERLRAEAHKAGLAWESAAMFGGSYADTLKEWTRNFTGAWEDIRRLGFDERFRQIWRFYLAYCEAGFRTGRIDVGQFALVRP